MISAVVSKEQLCSALPSQYYSYSIIDAVNGDVVILDCYEYDYAITVDGIEYDELIGTLEEHLSHLS